MSGLEPPVLGKAAGSSGTPAGKREGGGSEHPLALSSPDKAVLVPAPAPLQAPRGLQAVRMNRQHQSVMDTF